MLCKTSDASAEIRCELEERERGRIRFSCSFNPDIQLATDEDYVCYFKRA